jgi:hypothetical protein
MFRIGKTILDNKNRLYKMRAIIKDVVAMVLLVGSIVFTGSCAEEGEEARTPQAQISVNSQQLAVNESMTISFTGVADQVVIFTGDKDHQYELRDSSNTGFVVNKGSLTYSYDVPGTFHVVCIATTYDTYKGNGLQQDTTSLYVVVTDEVTDIDAIYTTVTPNVYYAKRQGEDWVLCLPTKQLYNNREMTVNTAKQRLSIVAGSDSAKVYIDDAPYVTKNYYALNTDHSIKVISGSGAEKDYRLYGMVYPEFLSISINGATPKLTRSAYYQDLLEYEGSGTLEFTVEPDVQLLANGMPVSTGITIRNDVEYTLVRTHAVNAEVKAVTRVKFTNNE